MDTVDILGVNVHQAGRQVILGRVNNWAWQNQPRIVYYVNAHCLNVAWRDPEYRRLLNYADLVYSDGIGVVWAAQFLSGVRLEKVTGRDWISAWCEQACSAGLSFYILGGRPGIALQARQRLLARWPGLNVLGASDGYFVEKSEAGVLAEIQALRPQVVFVGMGTPQQETWIACQREIIAAPVVWAVGALFDYVAGVEPPVPAWMNDLALEWLWRLSIDPRGKWRRYVLGNPLFVLRVLRQKWLAR